jgi:hypothetical protein
MDSLLSSQHRRRSLRLQLLSFVALSAIPSNAGWSQVAPPPRHVAADSTATRTPTAAQVNRPRADSPNTGDEPLILSPFEVREAEDQGYLATSAQSGTRLRSELKDIAAAVTVVTKDFMNDIGARNLEDLLTYTLNTEVGGISGNFSESVSSALNGGAEMNYDGAFQNVTPGTRIRGLTTADSTREFFTTKRAPRWLHRGPRRNQPRAQRHALRPRQSFRHHQQQPHQGGPAEKQDDTPVPD